jgi:hypothetical protein
MAEVSVQVSVPCVDFPKLPKIPKITLIGGVELNGFLDFSAGMPTDCSATFSLMQQLTPSLAGLAPILKILGVIKALADFASNPLIKGPDLIAAIGEIAEMFVALTPAGIAITIKGILELIINFLDCLIAQLKSAVEFQASISLIQQSVELDASLASPVLMASLSCAQDNAAIALEQAMGAVGPIKPLLDVVNIIAGIAGLPAIEVNLSASAGADMTGVITSLENSINSLKTAISSLPL